MKVSKSSVEDHTAGLSVPAALASAMAIQGNFSGTFPLDGHSCEDLQPITINATMSPNGSTQESPISINATMTPTSQGGAAAAAPVGPINLVISDSSTVNETSAPFPAPPSNISTLPAEVETVRTLRMHLKGDLTLSMAEHTPTPPPPPPPSVEAEEIKLQVTVTESAPPPPAPAPSVEPEEIKVQVTVTESATPPPPPPPVATTLEDIKVNVTIEDNRISTPPPPPPKVEPETVNVHLVLENSRPAVAPVTLPAPITVVNQGSVVNQVANAAAYLVRVTKAQGAWTNTGTNFISGVGTPGAVSPHNLFSWSMLHDMNQVATTSGATHQIQITGFPTGWMNAAPITWTNTTGSNFLSRFVTNGVLNPHDLFSWAVLHDGNRTRMSSGLAPICDETVQTRLTEISKHLNEVVNQRMGVSPSQPKPTAPPATQAEQPISIETAFQKLGELLTN